jgi:anaerobic dimethyl sulfoxide reductase subunit C (anchor subunit)
MPGRHWQLVAFTILTQLAAGLVVVLAVGLQLHSGSYDLLEIEALTAAVLEILLVLLALGVGVATIHLGSAGGALMTLANLRMSWLSREATAGIVFGLLTVAATVAYRLDLGSPGIRQRCVVAAAAAGVVLVYAMSRLYMLRTVPAWNSPATLASFLTTALLLGAAGSATALLALSGRFDVAEQLLSETLPWLAWCCLVLALLQLAMSARRVIATPAGKPPTPAPPLWLNGVLGLGGAGMLLACGRVADLGVASSLQTSAWVAVASALIVASEVVGRFRFYASYDRYGV